MNNEDMSNLINKFSEYMNSSNSNGNNISPEFIANMAKMMQNSNNKTNNDSTTTGAPEQDKNSSMPNFDMDTIIKMKTIFEQMNKKDDPRSNLLLSLKPYLKESRKNKVDQYAQLFNMTKIMDILNTNSNGGEASK